MQKIVHTRNDHELLSYDFLMALADAINALGLSRERTTNWLATVIYSWIEQSIAPDENGKGGIDYVILNGEGRVIDIYDEIFDDAYGNEASFCWNTNVKAFAKRRPQRKPAYKMLLRFQLWDAALKIAGRPIVLPTE